LVSILGLDAAEPGLGRGLQLLAERGHQRIIK
jgi:hypothetical protein